MPDRTMISPIGARVFIGLLQSGDVPQSVTDLAARLNCHRSIARQGLRERCQRRWALCVGKRGRAIGRGRRALRRINAGSGPATGCTTGHCTRPSGAGGRRRGGGSEETQRVMAMMTTVATCAAIMVAAVAMLVLALCRAAGGRRGR
jgi:hypothetical protein